MVTGILESLEREEVNDLVKQYGGKVMSTVGKRLNYLIVGEEAGPKKVAQATDYGIKIISEDEFLDMIRQSSNDAVIKTTGNNPGHKNKNSQEIMENNLSLSPINNNIKIKSPLSPTINRSPQKRNIFESNIEIKLESPPKKMIKLEAKSNFEEISEETIKIKTEKNNFLDEKLPKSINTIKTEISENMTAWVDKYKPTTVKDIVGQQGSASNVVK